MDKPKMQHHPSMTDSKAPDKQQDKPAPAQKLTSGFACPQERMGERANDGLSGNLKNK
jgi:hypothetical protein